MSVRLKISATILFLEDNFENLKNTINSISSEVDDIFVISDKNINNKNLNYNLIQNSKFDGDFSNYRNKVKEKLPDHLLLHLNCGETLETKNIKDYLDLEKNYNLNIIYDQFIIKETRITPKKNFTFTNRVFEIIDCENCVDSIIKINATKTDKKNLNKYLIEWEKKEPLSHQVYYYKTINNLYESNFEKFINDAEKLLFKSNLKEENELLIRYYLANVFLFKIKNEKKFTENILTLLAKKPDMAEFWCLAGDFWYTKNNYEKAIYFYNFALIASKYRNINDNMFYMPEKQNNYPEKMIKNCIKVKNHTETLLLKKNI